MKKFVLFVFWVISTSTLYAQNDTEKLKNVNPEDIDYKTLDAVAVKEKPNVPQKEGTSQTVLSFSQHNQALWVKTSGGTIYIQPYRKGGVHVMYGADVEIGRHRSFAVTTLPDTDSFVVKETGNEIVLTSSGMKLSVDKKQGFISFMDVKGKLLMREYPGKARMNVTNDSVNASCRFQLNEGDALYGLGQYRDGKLNLRRVKRELVQYNTQAAVPVIYSTGGWGLFWDNVSRTMYEDGSKGMTFASDYGKIVDYYIFVGDTFDQLVGEYRALTGSQPMLPDWALGYHQSRNRYHNWKEVIGVAKRMKEEKIPLSTLFIDYHYWGRYGTGSMRFDERIFPNVDRMLDSIHNTYGTKIVITMWPCFKPGTENYQRMSSKGYILEGSRAIDGYLYDVFNPEARKMYRQLILPLLKTKVDGWFLDGPEPDHIQSFLPQMTYLGPAQKVRNLYPLLHSENFYQAITAERPNERPYMLTRCAWAAQQKYGTAVWSGDIPTTFDELRKQVVAGLGFTATGIPYWTTDIGGYSGGDPADESYRELFARWFQYGTFCPIFRAHGRRYPGKTETPNELWAYGEKVQTICADYIRMRYELMPYIYSLAADVTFRQYTPMRLLAFDFADDRNVLDCKDQFMYGPSFMVCPILAKGEVTRKVYLPEGHSWIDYWTGKVYQGGQTLTADAPLERMPLYVKGGSIIPSYATIEPGVNTRTQMYVDLYEGADAEFDVYEDDGVSMEYKKGKYSVIPMKWSENDRVLTIGAKKGDFQTGKRTLVIRKPAADGTKTVIKKIKYNGKKIQVKL